MSDIGSPDSDFEIGQAVRVQVPQDPKERIGRENLFLFVGQEATVERIVGDRTESPDGTCTLPIYYVRIGAAGRKTIVPGSWLRPMRRSE